MTLKIIQIPVGALAMNATLVMDEESKESIFFDPGDEIDRILEIAEKKSKESGINQKDILNALGQDIPIKRIGRPEEFAPIVTFLCSDMASYITGNSINIDGGLIKSLF